MKKVILLCTLSLLFGSCRMIKQIDFTLKAERMAKKTEQTYHNNTKIPFLFNGQAVLIPCTINDSTKLVCYYSAMNVPGVHEFVCANSEFPKCNKTITLRIKNSDNQRIMVRSGLKYDHIKSDFFHLKNLLRVVESVSNDTVALPCKADENSHFSLGKQIFLDKNNILLLSFSDTTITLYDTDNYDKTDFTFVHSLNTCRGIEVCLTVDSIEYQFVFDTGYEGSLSLPYHKEYRKWSLACNHIDWARACIQYEKHQKADDLAVASFRKQTSSRVVMDTSIYQHTNTIALGNIESITSNIIYNKKNSTALMGMGFISHFDWIIDMYNGEIYVKQISTIDSFINPYRVGIWDGKLQISSLPVWEKKYQLSSTINSVNGIQVNESNICQMRDLLNKENGFKENVIIVQEKN